MNKLQNRLAKLAEPESTADMLAARRFTKAPPNFLVFSSLGTEWSHSLPLVENNAGFESSGCLLMHLQTFGDFSSPFNLRLRRELGSHGLCDIGRIISTRPRTDVRSPQMATWLQCQIVTLTLADLRLECLSDPQLS
ncbi:uncharacterized protein UDID_17082 [Ustilago sp. UG-2017a]|nr:uncharacterized protein UDID_17082 [Ustilago sp. UG-2017a]